MKNKTVFLDRDGTINVDVHYLDHPDNFRMYPGWGDGVKRLKDHGFRIIVITNQSGVGRGYFPEERVREIQEKMKMEFLKFAVELDGIYYCPHHPDDRCNCRKPNTGLFDTAIREHGISVKHSFMVGDKPLDIDAGRRVGVQTILIPEPPTRNELLAERMTWNSDPNYIAVDFADAVEWILEREEN